ncbi:hypothetical protein L917_07648 [Phytophthora nicotianae]|uniref:WW domain-containing protein n=1 Tax=Phytophthora nicotianae TaxID=4792 RepID=W2LAE1_PHYNI|nr:hypothetical protein L917_07648 [Phytophthora nicotianae]
MSISAQVGALELCPEADSAQHCKKPSDPSYSGSNKNDNEKNARNVIPTDNQALTLSEAKEFEPLSALDELPLLNRTIAKRGRRRSRKRDRYVSTKAGAPSASISRNSGDNQMAHSGGIDENSLPQIVKPGVPSSQKLNSPLRKMHNHRTWNGRLRQRGDIEVSRSLQRRVSSSDDTLAAFEATKTILLAEIESDERCASFLRQRVPEEARALYPDSPQSQILYKLRDLDRKILMNKEKLAQVRERIADLGGKPSWLTIDPKTELTGHEDKLLDANQQSQASTSIKVSSVAKGAVIIQCGYRAFRARRHLADLLAKTYQRVLNPENNQYFYYNRITNLSQWEAPTLLRRCHCPLDAKPLTLAYTNDPARDAAAKVIQNMFRQRALRVFMQDYKLGNLEKIFDARFGAWYYFNSRTNRSFWENVHHVRLTAANSAIYHPPS